MYQPPNDDPIVLKIIPIEGDLIVNGGPQKRFSEILSEIVIAEELSGLSNGKENKTDGFVKIKSVKCVKGAYPQHLLDAWEIYNDSSLKGSENDNPDLFDEDQLYIVFEQYNAGLDLEAFIFKNAEEAFSVFVQVSSGSYFLFIFRCFIFCDLQVFFGSFFKMTELLLVTDSVPSSTKIFNFVLLRSQIAVA